jgi:TolA-binding protein
VAQTLTVLRLLTKRKYFTPILIFVLAFPAVALAAGDGGRTTAPSVGPARVAQLAPLQRPVDRFQRLVHTISHQIKAEEEAAARKKEREREEEFAELPGGVSLSTLEAIASCESGGDPSAVSSDGTYRGSGDPAAAPEAEQDYRAALLYAASGSSPWPVCG